VRSAGVRPRPRHGEFARSLRATQGGTGLAAHDRVAQAAEQRVLADRNERYCAVAGIDEVGVALLAIDDPRGSRPVEVCRACRRRSAGRRDGRSRARGRVTQVRRRAPRAHEPQQIVDRRRVRCRSAPVRHGDRRRRSPCAPAWRGNVRPGEARAVGRGCLLGRASPGRGRGRQQQRSAAPRRRPRCRWRCRARASMTGPSAPESAEFAGSLQRRQVPGEGIGRGDSVPAAAAAASGWRTHRGEVAR
jgi:hypothetical protein